MTACSGDDEVAGETLNTVKQLVRKGEVRVSAHGYDEINRQDWDEGFIRR